MKHIALLGATGSIGGNVLEIVRQFPERYRIVSLAAGQNIALLAAQTTEFQPLLVATGDAAGARKLRQLVPASWSGDIVYGEKGAIQAASLAEAEVVVSAIVGAAGLLPTLAAIRAGKDIALANKETLVMAGAVVMQELAAYGGHLFPVDSEHSAIFQALEAGRRQDAAKIILTASGGPFLGQTARQLQQVTPQQALRHPRWQMGQKISIDSATLMNKGLEVIEAHWLFAMPAAQIEVVVHPQSVVHSLVEFCDGSVVAQLGIADMRIPIAYALSYPERLPLCLPSLSLTQWSQLDFMQPDLTSFPALRLAYEAAACGGAAPAVLNAANEVAVAAFLQEQLAFPDICRVVEATLQKETSGQGNDLESILAADASARRTAAGQIQALS